MFKKVLLSLIVAGTIGMNLTGVVNAAEQTSTLSSSYIAAQATVTGMVIGTNVNLRSGPGTNYSSYGQVNYGDTLEVLLVYDGSADVWAKVRMTSGPHKGEVGCIDHDYIIYT